MRYATWLIVWSSLLMPLDRQPAGQTPAADEPRCSALMQLDLERGPDGPARVTIARLVDVPSSGLDSPANSVSGFGRRRDAADRRIIKYCSVSGYVAPQNKFELRLPLRADWNHKFFFTAC